MAAVATDSPQVDEDRSGVFYFPQQAAGYVVYEAAHDHLLRNPWMRPELLQLVAHVLLDVLKRVEKRRADRRGSGAILDSVAQIVFIALHQSAIGMIDDHDFFRAQQVMRHHQ